MTVKFTGLTESRGAQFLNAETLARRHRILALARRKSRMVMLAASLILIGLGTSSCLIREIGGAFRHEPEELEPKASADAKRLIDEAFSAIDPTRLVDYHTHIVGLGTDGSGAFANPKTQEWFGMERLKFLVYTSAAGVRNIAAADQEYVARLVRLARGIKPGGKFRILAFDKFYRRDGSVDLSKTNFYMPNEQIFKLAQEYPDIFQPVISVHPYRSDALAELEKWARRGAKFVKWLPNAMGMDPADPQVDSFYRKMKEHEMILLSHTGEEQAVEAEENQALGNPLRLRRALDHGVRVIMAHVASLGTCENYDQPEKPKSSCFDLAMALFAEPRYEKLLFGEISAMVQFNRMPRPLSILLTRPELHRRLVNGSDYPLPAINILIHTGSLARDGFISDRERDSLNEIYDYNPLLFDFVLKRTLRHPVTKQKLSPSIFMANPGLAD